MPSPRAVNGASVYVPAGNGPSGNSVSALLVDGVALWDDSAVGAGDDAGLADGLGTDPTLP